MKCIYHSERDPIGMCVNCGKPICEECKVDMGGKYYCNPCAEKTITIPNEIKGWSWGAFLLGWIWGVGNNVWIALFCLIPYVGIVMNFVIGAKGNEWAWQKKKWDSIEQFKKTQSKWAWWGLGINIVIFVLGVLTIVIAAAKSEDTYSLIY